MIEFIKHNSAVVPFAIAAMCNFWVALDIIINKKCVSMGVVFLSYTLASLGLCWHYLTLGEN
jgi:hypothetical protein